MTYRTQASLAKRLGITQQRVNALIHAEGWRWGKPPWTEGQARQIDADLRERRAMNNATQAAADAGDDADLTPLTRARNRLMLAQLGLLDLENAVRRGEHLDAGEVNRLATGAAARFRTAIQRLGINIAFKLAGKDEVGIRDVIAEEMGRLLEKLAHETETVFEAVATPDPVREGPGSEYDAKNITDNRPGEALRARAATAGKQAVRGRSSAPDDGRGNRRGSRGSGKAHR